MSSYPYINYHHIDQSQSSFQASQINDVNITSQILNFILSHKFPSSSSTSNIQFKINNQFQFGLDALPKTLPLSVLNAEIIDVRSYVPVLGGKGGFGSMLRAQGGRMNSKKTSNTDACRDLSGRRLKTVKAAKQLKEYLETEEDRVKDHKDRMEKKIAKKRKLQVHKAVFDDTEYLQQTETLKENIRDAVQRSLKDNGKKRKIAHSRFNDDEVSESSEEESEEEDEESEEDDSEEESEEEEDNWDGDNNNDRVAVMV